jgi:hyperosmotically inducible periplasmic protein
MSTSSMRSRPALHALGLASLFLVTCLAVACGTSDADLKTAVETQIAADPITSASTVTVTVEGGAVRLAGQTPSRAAQQRAVEIARSIKGVKDVVSTMTLNDAVVEAAVRQALAADPLVGPIGIDVKAKDGTVQLHSAKTNADDRKRAVDVAKGVDGVTGVEDWMR